MAQLQQMQHQGGGVMPIGLNTVASDAVLRPPSITNIPADYDQRQLADLLIMLKSMPETSEITDVSFKATVDKKRDTINKFMVHNLNAITEAMRLLLSKPDLRRKYGSDLRGAYELSKAISALQEEEDLKRLIGPGLARAEFTRMAISADTDKGRLAAINRGFLGVKTDDLKFTDVQDL